MESPSETAPSNQVAADDPLFMVGLSITDERVADYASTYGTGWSSDEMDCVNGVQILGDPGVGLIGQVNIMRDYESALPWGMTWDMTPADFAAALGEPVSYNEFPPMAGLPASVSGSWNVNGGNVQSLYVDFDPDTKTPIQFGFYYEQASTL